MLRVFIFGGLPGRLAQPVAACRPHKCCCQGQGHFITSKSIGGKMLGDRRELVLGSEGPGPAAYHPAAAYDSLAHYRGSDYCGM